jgi:hypothetical protein
MFSVVPGRIRGEALYGAQVDAEDGTQQKITSIGTPRVLQNDSYIGTERSRGYLQNWRTSKRVRRYFGPLVVLIDPITASAAEIFAAAVKDNARGPLLGRMSNGAVLKGHLFPLPDGGQVQVPVSDFVRAGDRRIEGVGVEPDIRVIPSLAEIHAGRDTVIERAMLKLRNIARDAALHPNSARLDIACGLMQCRTCRSVVRSVPGNVLTTNCRPSVDISILCRLFQH